MTTFEEYLETVKNPEISKKLQEIFGWIDKTYPELVRRVAWNAPNYTHHGTFIIGLSSAAKHISINPEPQGMREFSQEIERAGYSQTPNIYRILHNQEVDYGLLKRIIDFNIMDKKDCDSFWRK